MLSRRIARTCRTACINHTAICFSFPGASQKFSEDGTLTTLYRTWFNGLSQCGDGSAAILESSRLGVDQMLGAFVFLLFGALAAFILSNCENLKWCLVKAYSNPNTMVRARGCPARARACVCLCVFVWCVCKHGTCQCEGSQKVRARSR